MTRTRAESFIAALQALEEQGDVEPIVACFAADAALSDLSRTEHGREGAAHVVGLERLGDDAQLGEHGCQCVWTNAVPCANATAWGP